MLKKFWKDSWVKFWGHLQWTSALGLASIHLLSGVLNDGNVKTALQSMNLKPEAYLILAILGVVTLISAEH